LPGSKKDKDSKPKKEKKEKKGKKEKKIKKGAIPTKNFINIQVNKKKKFSLKKNLPVIILIAILFIVFCKFMVIDRLTATVTESAHVAELQQELTQTNSKIKTLSKLDDEYAHYTTSGMTEEELERVDRVKAMRLIQDAFMHGNVSKSWNLTGNIMTLQVTGSSLKGLSQLASELESRPIVERCVTSSADKNSEENNGKVEVTFTIYLQQPKENEEP
jgi:hypothetical protein